MVSDGEATPGIHYSNSIAFLEQTFRQTPSFCVNPSLKLLQAVVAIEMHGGYFYQASKQAQLATFIKQVESSLLKGPILKAWNEHKKEKEEAKEKSSRAEALYSINTVRLRLLFLNTVLAREFQAKKG